MRYKSVTKAVELLRRKSSTLRQNNPRLDGWVDSHLQESVMTGKTVTILTQWCFSKDLEVRRKKQGGRFTPTKGERRLFESELLGAQNIFSQAGVKLSWIITLNRSYLDSGRLSAEIEAEYEEMIGGLARPLENEGWLMVLNWEDDCLNGRAQPSTEVLEQVESFTGDKALRLEIDRHSRWAKEEAGVFQSKAELEKDVRFQIACEAEEGRLLAGDSSLMGDVLLAPLEYPERYDFFTLLCPDFKKRIVTILSPYPWRLDT